PCTGTARHLAGHPRRRRLVVAPAVRRHAPDGDERAGLDPDGAPGQRGPAAGGDGGPDHAGLSPSCPGLSPGIDFAAPSRPRSGGSRLETAVLAEQQSQAAQAVLAEAGGRLAAYVALTKPRIAVMVLVTVAT